MNEIAAPGLTVAAGLLEGVALVYDELVAGRVEGGQIGVGRGAGARAPVYGELVRGEDLDLAQAQAALDPHQLQEHVLAHQGPGAGERLGDTFLWNIILFFISIYIFNFSVEGDKWT